MLQLDHRARREDVRPDRQRLAELDEEGAEGHEHATQTRYSTCAYMLVYEQIRVGASSVAESARLDTKEQPAQSGEADSSGMDGDAGKQAGAAAVDPDTVPRASESKEEEEPPKKEESPLAPALAVQQVMEDNARRQLQQHTFAAAHLTPAFVDRLRTIAPLASSAKI